MHTNFFSARGCLHKPLKWRSRVLELKFKGLKLRTTPKQFPILNLRPAVKLQCTNYTPEVLSDFLWDIVLKTHSLGASELLTRL